MATATWKTPPVWKILLDVNPWFAGSLLASLAGIVAQIPPDATQGPWLVWSMYVLAVGLACVGVYDRYRAVKNARDKEVAESEAGKLQLEIQAMRARMADCETSRSAQSVLINHLQAEVARMTELLEQLQDMTPWRTPNSQSPQTGTPGPGASGQA